MHPIERLRMVARATGAGGDVLVREAAGALAAFGDDPPGLVTACRRLVDRQPSCGPIWWLAARVLASGEPVAEAWRAVDDLEADDTVEELVRNLPDDATVTLLGWPEQGGEAVRRRGDLEVLVVDSAGAGGGLVRRLESAGVDAWLVPEAGLGAAAGESAVVLVEALALGPDGVAAVAGSRAAAAVGRHAGAEVWAVAGVGRVLPGRLWAAYTARLDERDEPWDAEEEIVPLDLVDRVAGPTGLLTTDAAVRRADCPVAPELLKGA